MEVHTLGIDGLKVFQPRQFSDARGFFSETYSAPALAEAGIDAVFVQDNHSLSRDAGVIRGLHFQIPPHAQDKLVRVVRGSIFDVAVDIRVGSPTFGKHASVDLSAENWKQLFVPKGFAHGFCTLEPDTEVIYKVSAPYAPDADRGIAWDDPALAIAWPLDGRMPILSDKDQNHPELNTLPAVFHHETACC
jgi:dTDP-4-dehydrorhamnose 3,5-epimerase